MDSGQLRETPRPWMRINTWHSNQPADNERFHKALKAAFEKLGPATSLAHFKQAMADLAEEYYSHLENLFKQDRIRHFVTRAHQIILYLADFSHRSEQATRS